MKIVVVHQNYLMPGHPGGSRFNEFARFWTDAGHDVTVLAGNLNYSTGETPERYRGKRVVREQDGPVTVYRCHVPPSYSKGYRGRMQAFLGFTFSSALAAMRIPRPDVVIATSPPLVTVVPGFCAAKLHWPGVPWIFEVRDLWPESAVTTGVLKPDAAITKALYAIERWACWSAARVNVLTPAFRDDILQRGLCGPEKIIFVPNGADVEHFKPGPRDNTARREAGWGDRKVVLYAGAHGRANALRQLLDAADHLRDRPDIVIATVGDGPERASLTAEAQQRGLTNILFHGPKSKDAMPDFVNACDIGAAVLQDNPTFRTVYPNKVFDYMACERPTVLAIDGVARRLVCDEANAGVFTQPEDGRALAGTIRSMLNDPEGCAAMGKRGRAWVLQHATRESLAQRYLTEMQKLVSETR
jgi:glycosyltransferase involved in cell wall biosynthesis